MDPVVEIESLSKRYGDVAAVEDVSITVARGESFGYLGPNGAGKTTTIRCMLGFIRPSSGRVRLFGLDVARALDRVLERVGYVPGEFGLWPAMTGEQTLDYLGRLHPRPPKRLADLCDRLELSRADLQRSVRTYSRGMKQKIGLVQAFQHAPELVVLDEPTEGLDPVMKERVVDLLREQTAGGGSVFLSSHILSEVETSTDRVAIIKAGRLATTGPTRDVTGERVRHCVLTLKEAAPGLLDIQGVSNLTGSDGLHVRFEFRGDMEPLMQRLARARVAEFLAEPESLTDAFFDIFGEQR